MEAKEKKARKLPFNIIDVIIILAVLALGAGIFMRIQLKRQSVSKELQTVTVTVKVRRVLAQTDALISKGDVFYQKSDMTKLGEVSSKELFPAVIYTAGPDGKLIRSEYDLNDRVDMVIALAVEGISSESGFLIAGSKYIAPGSSLTMISGDLELFVQVLKIDS